MPESADRLIFDPAEYFDGLIADIDKAHSEVVLETYIFRLDEVGTAVIEALQRACGRGVFVRLLIDGVGSYIDTTRLVEMLESINCEIRIFHPLPWDFKVFRNALSAGQDYSDWLYSIANINRRNHRKLCIVDAEIAWLGSFNITADHFNRLSRNEVDNWHDTGLRIRGGAVPMLLKNFEQVWSRKGENRRRRSRQFLAISAIRGRKQSATELIDTLIWARSRIFITNAYFNPANRVLRILRKAAGRGVQIRVIVPARSDVFFFPSLSRTYYADLLNAGIRIFEYEKSVLHSKTMLIDDAVLVGSTNLNYRSFIHDLELDALVYEPSVVTQMEQKFSDDLESCSEITLQKWRKYPLVIKSLAWIPRLLRYWL